MPAIPESTKTSLAQRLGAHARKNWSQLAQVHVRYHGQFAYVAGELANGERLPLMRLRYGGSATIGEQPSTWPVATATRTKSGSAAAPKRSSTSFAVSTCPTPTPDHEQHTNTEPSTPEGLPEQTTKKPPRTLETMREGWRDRLGRLFGTDGHTELAYAVQLDAIKPVTVLSSVQLDGYAHRIIAEVSGQRSVWTRWNVHAETERLLRQEGVRFASVADQKKVAEMVTAHALSTHSIELTGPELHAVSEDLRRRDGVSLFTEHAAQRYTSQAVLDAEQWLLAAANTPAAQPVPAKVVAGALAVFEANTGRALDSGQRALVTTFATAPVLLAAGIGAAGTGKTTAMQALRTVVEADGGRLIPLATSSAAAATLGAAIGARAENVHKFLHEHRVGADALRLAHGHPVAPK